VLHCPIFDCIAIRERASGTADTDTAVRPTYVFDYDGLTEQHFHSLGHDARDHIRRSTRSKRHHHSDRPRRVGLCPSVSCDGGESGSTRYQMQKLAARKFHRVPSLKCSQLINVASDGHRRYEQGDFHIEIVPADGIRLPFFLKAETSERHRFLGST
jgi:hypothetical protein